MSVSPKFDYLRVQGCKVGTASRIKKMTSRKRYDKKRLLELFSQGCSTLIGISGETVDTYEGRLGEKTIIDFTCECGNTGSKRFRNISEYGAFCETCAMVHKIARIQASKKESLSFDKSFAAHPQIAFFIPELNPGIDPRKIGIQSAEPLVLKCPTCSHIYPGKAHGLKNCRFCEHQELCDNNDCIMCFDNSLASRHFESIDVFKQFKTLTTSDESSTDDVIPLFKDSCDLFDFKQNTICCRKIFKSSSKTICLFICRNCNHSFPSQPSRIEELKDCPYCSPSNAKMLCPKEKECKLCFDKSFASHPKSAFWDYGEGKNAGKTPYDVFRSGSHRADMICSKCEHKFSISCNNISTGYWCPYCSGQKRCYDNSCKICSSRKLSSHASSIYWDYDKNPSDISPDNLSLNNSRIKCWMKCPLGKHQSYEITPSHINRNQGCPSCVRKTESKIGEFLSKNNIKYIKEFSPEWLKINSGQLRFDFYLPDLKLIIELDGRQHFTQTHNWLCPAKQTERDVWKMKQANQNGLYVIRLLQEEVFKYNEEWLDAEVLPELVRREDNLFIAIDIGVYDIHIKLMD